VRVAVQRATIRKPSALWRCLMSQLPGHFRFMLIVTINVGSSSIKSAVFEMSALAGRMVFAADVTTANGQMAARVTREGRSTPSDEPIDAAPDGALAWILARLEDEGLATAVSAVGHRIVHGGGRYRNPVWLTADVRADLHRLETVTGTCQANPYNWRSRSLQMGAGYGSTFRGALGHPAQEYVMSDAMIRVMLADDHAVVRSGLRAVLGGAKDMIIVGEASTGAQAIVMAQRCDPDVIVMDLDMPDTDGLEATKAIVARGPRPRVLILTMHTEEEHLLPVLQAGAAGYLVKSAADRELVDAVRAVSHGDVYVQPTASRVLVHGLTKRDPAKADRERYEGLNARERDVLRLTAQGYSAPEIGAQLNISAKTVDTYKQRINEKLGLAHRADYVRLAARLNLLTE
jgi:two-component system, NarL family, response regulator NreC